jgi:3-oxoacyl-[acyl-carrier-protein] synthase-3
MPGCSILGAGFAVPERVVCNGDIAPHVDVSAEWILSRTGIQTRRTVVGTELATSDLAVAAARAALERAGVDPGDLDQVVVATASGDYLMPATASLVQAALGARRAAAFDLNAACSGFVYGLGVASHTIAAGAARFVLLVGADTLTRHVDERDRNTAILFGDGAGAVVLGPGDALLGLHLGSDGAVAADLIIPAGGSRRPVDAAALAAGAHKIRMNGREVFRAAVQAMTNGLLAAVAAAGVRMADLRWVVTHQANARIVRAVAERVGLPLEAFLTHLQRYGNTGAASIPIALAEASEAGALAPGDLLGLTAAGAGLTWGAAVVRWGAAA